MAIRSRVLAEPLLILHFVLKGIDASGTPPVIVDHYLQAYLPRDQLHYREVRFDFSTDDGIITHATEMGMMVKGFAGCVYLSMLIFLLTMKYD
jgi:hypothetical protein